MGGVGKCFGVALIALGGLSAVFGIVSIFLCQSDLKYVGAPLWSGIFLMITGAVGLGTGFRPKSNGWLTAFLVLSVLSLVVVACSFVILICGVVYDSYMYNYYDDSYNYYDYPKRQDHLNWPDIPHMFGDYSEGDSYGSSSRWNGEFDDMDDLQDHLNLPNGWNTRPDELQDWLDSLANQDIENLDLPENWEDWYLFLQNWLNEHREEEVEGEDEEETRHGGGGGRHRPIHNGDRDGDNMMEYADDYSYDWGSYDHHVSTALYGVTIILTFIELVVLFAGSVASCCGLCNSTTSNMTTVKQNHQPQVYILQPGQTVLPQTNGQFIIVQRPPNQVQQNFTPSTNPALEPFPTKEPVNRLPPVELQQAGPLPEKVELA